MACSTKCALLPGAAVHQRRGRLTDQNPLEPVRGAPQIHRESTGGPVKLRKATAPPHAAAIHFWLRTRPSEERGPSSSAAIHLLPPSGDTAAIAER